MRIQRGQLKLETKWRVWLAFLLLAMVAGCREKPTTVSGTITVDGQPLQVPADGRGTIVFQPNGGRGTVATGLLDSTGHFKLAIGSSNEVPPGEYHVTVSLAKLLPPAEGQERGAELMTPSKYASAMQSGLTAKVEPGPNDFTFNLDSKTIDAAPANESATPAVEAKPATSTPAAAQPTSATDTKQSDPPAAAPAESAAGAR